MNFQFKKDIIKSGYIHRPLKLNEKDSFESRHSQQEIIEKRELFSTTQLIYQWKHRHQGKSYINENNELVLTSATRLESWPPGSPDDGDYCNFGQTTVYCELPGLNLLTYNRICFEIYVDFDGAVNPHIIVGFQNDGVIKIPDIYNREGYHTINLKNHQWNTCYLEISDLPRDTITELSLSSLINGQDRATGPEMIYKIRKVQLERINNESISKGWIPKTNTLIYSHNGYHQSSSKIAFITNSQQDSFQLYNQNNEIVFEGTVNEVSSFVGQYQILDFSEFQSPGKYYLCIGKVKSEIFTIDGYINRWTDSIWKSLNFIYCERCGCPIPDKHGSCHEDILATHLGKSIIFNGGWHDAGDVSQQLVQTAEVTLSLFEMSSLVKEDEELYLRLLEEAEWGFDFILKTRFGDGYRATSAGITIWSNGLIGDMDDMQARVHNNAYENFFLAGIEAQIAMLMEDDNRLKASAKRIAVEDYRFAMERYEIDGLKHEPIFWEHTYSTSESLFYATMSWASSLLFQLTFDDSYANKARDFLSEMLACQESEGISLKDGTYLKGFFYRDSHHKVIQHFNHQAREHLYAQALDKIIETQGHYQDINLWQESLKNYGDYLVYLMKYTYPYPMIPSGIYKDNEQEDEISFYKQHLLVGEEAKEDYFKQLKFGHHIAPTVYLKKFPV